MLALFLRRAGLRVVYLGQNIAVDHLIATVETVRPACLLLSAALRPQAEALIEVGRRLAALGPRQPIVYFGGHAFDGEPDLAVRAHGAYLGLDAHKAAQEIKRRLSA
jgi:methanogenic corrinoid protein MtbC1